MQVRESNEQVRAGAQASKLPAPPPAHPDVYEHLRIFKANFSPQSWPYVPMFTYKANFGEKVGLKNEQVNMNE